MWCVFYVVAASLEALMRNISGTQLKAEMPTAHCCPMCFISTTWQPEAMSHLES